MCRVVSLGFAKLLIISFRRTSNWSNFITQFGESVKHVTGLNIEARTGSGGRLEDEIVSLRAQVEEHTREVSLINSDLTLLISYVEDPHARRAKSAGSRADYSASAFVKFPQPNTKTFWEGWARGINSQR